MEKDNALSPPIFVRGILAWFSFGARWDDVAGLEAPASMHRAGRFLNPDAIDRQNGRSFEFPDDCVDVDLSQNQTQVDEG